MTEKKHTIRSAVAADLPVIEKLLVDSDLVPVELAANLDRFLVAEQGEIIGVIGSEYAEEAVLIRSVAVRPTVRNSGVASALLQKALVHAKAAGCKVAYLFTNTAAEYFSHRGFQVVPRSKVSTKLLASPAVTVCCCATAVAMRRELA
jgi:amino-acid N-acetyltransferase